MTHSNDNNSDRLTRIEALVESNARTIQATSTNIDKLSTEIQETKAIANSNSRAIQAMMEQETTNRLRHEEAMRQMREMNANHEQRIALLENVSSRLTEVQLGMARMLGNHDEDRPTILRRLMSIENKVDQILDRNPE